MKSLFAVVVSVCALALAGCESTVMPAGIREKFTGPVYRRDVLPQDRAAVFDAARSAVREMGFTISKSGAAQGLIEGFNGIASSDTLRGSSQRLINVRISDDPGGTEVEVLFSQVVQDDFAKGAGLGTQTPLRDTPLYAVFFRTVREKLVPAAGSPAPQP